MWSVTPSPSPRAPWRQKERGGREREKAPLPEQIIANDDGRTTVSPSKEPSPSVPGGREEGGKKRKGLTSLRLDQRPAPTCRRQLHRYRRRTRAERTREKPRRGEERGGENAYQCPTKHVAENAYPRPFWPVEDKGELLDSHPSQAYHVERAGKQEEKGKHHL